MPSLHQLTVFQSVARHLNFSRAAEELFLSQPAVTRQVQLLERQFGLSLLDRRGRRMQLTDAGQEVLVCAQRIEGLLDELDASLHARQGLTRGKVRLIATTTAGEYLLPHLVAGFRRLHPGLVVSLQVSNRHGVLRALAAGEADLAVMGRPPAGTDWTSRAILPNELVAIAAPQHPRLSGPACHIAELDDTFFVREPGSGTRLTVERFLEEAGRSLDGVVELGSDSAIKQVVMAGLGIAILSRQALELELSVGRLAVLPVIGLPLRLHWFLVQPGLERPPPAVVAFSAYLDAAVSLGDA